MALTEFDAVDEEGWLVVRSSDWWKVSYDSIPWSYSRPKFSKEELPVHLPLPSSIAKPPHYHELLFSDGAERPNKHTSSSFDNHLNTELVGAKAADNVLRPYESCVGFYTSLTSERPVTSFFTDDVSVVSAYKQKWVGMMIDLMGVEERKDIDIGDSKGCSSDYCPFDFDDDDGCSAGSLDRSTSTLSDDISMPSTPKPELGNKLLNAQALSFVPTTDSDIPIYFPTLLDPVPRIPLVKIQKDEHGFYSEVAALLNDPVSPRRSHKPHHQSRTRAIIDKLRSHPTDNDGWIDADSLSKTQRTRNLCQALSLRQRGDSDAGWVTDVWAEPSKLNKSNDGWVEPNKPKAGPKLKPNALSFKPAPVTFPMSSYPYFQYTPQVPFAYFPVQMPPPLPGVGFW